VTLTQLRCISSAVKHIGLVNKFLSDGALSNVAGTEKNFSPFPSTGLLINVWYDFRYCDIIAILDTWDGIVIVAPISGIAQHYSSHRTEATDRRWWGRQASDVNGHWAHDL